MSFDTVHAILFGSRATIKLGRKHQLFKTISEENYDTDSWKKSYSFSDCFSVTQL
jgi:hypothetical protein